MRSSSVGIDGVVLDGVAGAHHLRLLEAGDRRENRELHVDGQRGGHAVDVDLVGIQALGLEEKLVRQLVGELHDLVLDRRAVSRADGLDLAAIHGRAVDVLADDAVRLRGREGDVARHLAVVVRDAAGAEAEGRGIGVAGLGLEARPVDGARVQARRRAGLEAASAQAESLERFAQKNGGRLAGAAGGIWLLAAVDQAVEERTGGDDDRGGGDAAAVAEENAGDAVAQFPVARFSVVSGFTEC